MALKSVTRAPLHRQTEPVREFRITPQRLCLALGGIVLGLLIMNLLVIYFRYVHANAYLRGFANGFYFDFEANFPSAYSAAAIILSAVLLWKIGAQPQERARGHTKYWRLLSLVFVFIAVDEFAVIHETLIMPVKQMISGTSLASDFLHFAWLVPYILLTLALVAFLFRFLLRIPASVRNTMVLAGVVFVLGAVGMEMVGGNYWAAQGWAVDGSDEVNSTYALIVTVEELLEMVGIIIFIYGLSQYYLTLRGNWAVRVLIARDEKGARPPGTTP